MGKGWGLLLGRGGVAIRLQGGGCYSGTLRGSLCGIFESQGGRAISRMNAYKHIKSCV